jgi:glycosyltransferase involved in cell wall biosynthesis
MLETEKSGENPLFSVIIPLYNKENYIKRALFSALNQTIRDFEIIIINDACTDNSLERVKEIQDKRIRILQRETPGPGGYAARNFGIEHAKGTYISFLDADDEWMPLYLEQIIILIKQYPRAGAYFTAYERICANGKRKINKFSHKNRRRKTKYVSREEFFISVSKSMSPIITSCFTIKKINMRKAGGFPEGKCRKGGDVETWMRIGLSCDFAWSSYKGLLYYQDISNQVTDIYSGPRIPYVYYTATDLLNKLDQKQAILVKKYVNYYIRWNIKRSITRNIVLKDLLHIYFKEVNMSVYLFYKITCSLPSLLRTTTYKIYNMIKQAIGLGY